MPASEATAKTIACVTGSAPVNAATAAAMAPSDRKAAKSATVPTSTIAKMRATAIQNTVTDTPLVLENAPAGVWVVALQRLDGTRRYARPCRDGQGSSSRHARP